MDKHLHFCRLRCKLCFDLFDHKAIAWNAPEIKLLSDCASNTLIVNCKYCSELTHRHLLHNAVFGEYVLLQTHPSPRGTHRDQTKNDRGKKRKVGSEFCRHNRMSHRSAVLLCPCLLVCHLSCLYCGCSMGS